MTAPTPYSIQDQKDSAAQVNVHPDESRQERIEDLLLELLVFLESLGTVGELMMDSDGKCDSGSIGGIIDHYTGLITDGLGEIQECLLTIRN